LRIRRGIRGAAWLAAIALPVLVPIAAPAGDDAGPGTSGAAEPPPVSDFAGPAYEDWLLGFPTRVLPRPRGSETPDYSRGKAVDGPLPGRRLLLTFDDGPFPETTPRLLDMLKREGVPAVFFLVGSRVQDIAGRRHGRQIVRRMVAEGHVVGNHSWSHPHLPTLGENGWKSQITRTHDAVRSVAGYAPTLFRPPYGRTNASIDRYSSYRGYTKVMWGYTADEFRGLAAQTVARGLLESIAERERAGRDPGGVVLLHDAHGRSVDAAEIVIRRLKAENCAVLEQDERNLWRFVPFTPFFEPINGPPTDRSDPGATPDEIAAARAWCEVHAAELDAIRAIDEVALPPARAATEDDGGYAEP
jgi:peptidoglycan/xylan/chitin deacetylase (PgdA/CDA1 family)